MSSRSGSESSSIPSIPDSQETNSLYSQDTSFNNTVLQPSSLLLRQNRDSELTDQEEMKDVMAEAIKKKNEKKARQSQALNADQSSNTKQVSLAHPLSTLLIRKMGSNSQNFNYYQKKHFQQQKKQESQQKIPQKVNSRSPSKISLQGADPIHDRKCQCLLFQQMLARAIFSKSLRSFGAIEPKARGKIPKVVDQIIWLHVMTNLGQKYTVPGFEGVSILNTLQRNGVPISSSCQGGDNIIPMWEEPADPLRYGPTCGECQIVIFEPWVHQMKELDSLERNILLRHPGRFFTPQSRLACCLALKKWMNGMVISIPFTIPAVTEERNEWFIRGVNKVFDE